MGKEVKTNVMRILDRNKVPYEILNYECDEFIDGLHTAQATGAPVEQSFKTLVAKGKSGGYYVFVIPIAEEVDLKAAARSVGEKSVEMIHVKDITAITGYVRGGTDGARLSFMGLPCPNLGTGSYACHGPYEHATAEGMDIVVDTLTELVRLYGEMK